MEVRSAVLPDWHKARKDVEGVAGVEPAKVLRNRNGSFRTGYKREAKRGAAIAHRAGEVVDSPVSCVSRSQGSPLGIERNCRGLGGGNLPAGFGAEPRAAKPPPGYSRSSL